jgi:hypothetical protein
MLDHIESACFWPSTHLFSHPNHRPDFNFKQFPFIRFGYFLGIEETMDFEEQWDDARRIEAWAGEVRVNLIRLAAIVAFYGYHLINVFLVSGNEGLRGTYHATVTTLVMAWAATVMLLYFCLSRRYVPPWLKYASTLWDIFLITGLIALTKDKPTSPLLVLYFVVIASSGLRLSLRLVYAATLGSIAAYLFLLGFYAFWVIGAEAYYGKEGFRIPRSHEVIFVLALGATGICAGKVVRQARRLVEGYPVTIVDGQ